MKTMISASSIRRRNFSLLELYVIMGVLIILFLLMFHRLDRSKEFARDALCLSNTIQIATGFQLYLQDNNMQIPDVTYFLTDFTPYHPYVKSLGVYKCPSSATKPLTTESQLVLETDYMTSGTLQDIERHSNFNNGHGNNPYHFDPSNPSQTTQKCMKAKKTDRIVYERNYRNHVKGRRSFNIAYPSDRHGIREYNGVTQYWTLDWRGWIETSLSPWP